MDPPTQKSVRKVLDMQKYMHIVLFRLLTASSTHRYPTSPSGNRTVGVCPDKTVPAAGSLFINSFYSGNHYRITTPLATLFLAASILKVCKNTCERAPKLAA